MADIHEQRMLIIFQSINFVYCEKYWALMSLTVLCIKTTVSMLMDIVPLASTRLDPQAEVWNWMETKSPQLKKLNKCL